MFWYINKVDVALIRGLISSMVKMFQNLLLVCGSSILFFISLHFRLLLPAIAATMNQDSPSSDRRKRRFIPKAPQPSRKPKPPVLKTEDVDEEREAAEARSILNRVTANLTRQGPKVEKKSSVQVAFGYGATSSTTIRSFGVRRDGNGGKSADLGLKSSTSDDGRTIISSTSTAKEDGTDAHSLIIVDASAPKIKKEYKEPWDYHHTYYPTTLPLRRPFSGDPELLDEAEFGEGARNLEYDENITTPASDLGLLEEHENERMFFFQLPANLPVVKRAASTKGKEKDESSTPVAHMKKSCKLEELPEGCMGKMLVYKSGAIKLKLGETLYDVSPGLDGIFAQDVVAINTTDKHCCILGQLGKRAIVTPDIDSLINSVNDLG